MAKHFCFIFLKLSNSKALFSTDLFNINMNTEGARIQAGDDRTMSLMISLKHKEPAK